MLELNYIRENAAEVAARLAIKNIDATDSLNKIIDIDARRREAQKQLDDNLAESNAIARQVGDLFKSGKAAEAGELKARTAELKIQAKDISEKLDNLTNEQNNLLVLLPNVPHPSVPKGKTPEDNEIVHSEGEMPKLYEGAVPHWDLALKYDIIDFELGNKVTGAGFPFYKGQGARLQRALINFFLDNAVEAGYREIQPPLVVNEASGYGTGQLPDKDGQMYFCEVDKLYLIPTAEVPITNIYRDVIVKASRFPDKECSLFKLFQARGWFVW